MEGRLQAPFSCTVFASRESGKTTFTKNLLLNQVRMVSPPFERVVWVAKYPQAWLETQLKSQNFEVLFLNEIPQDVREITNGKSTCLVLDDCMAEASSSQLVQELFTGGRHVQISPILLAQNLYFQGKTARNIALNSDYIVLFRNNRDQSQINRLAGQMYPKNRQFFHWAYTEATAEPFGYLFLDLKQRTDPSLRVRSNILGPFQNIYVPKSMAIPRTHEHIAFPKGLVMRPEPHNQL